MTITEQSRSVPQLRFPEFEEEWVEKKLGKIAETIGGGTPDTSKKEYWNGDIVWLTPTEIKEKYISDSVRKITKLGLQKSSAKLLPKGTLLFTSRATIGDVGIAEVECTTNQGFQSFIPNDNYDTFFLYNWIIKNRKKFIRKASGSTFLEISKTAISTIKISIPTPPEQTKIANFLTAVDKRINLLQKKKVELEQYKKGVMQKLFSQEIRFKQDDGSDFPDWEEKKLGDLGKTYNGLTGKTKVDFGKGKPYIQYMQIFSSSKINTTNFGFVNIEENENQNSAKYGDVFFTTSSETPNEIGTSSVLTEEIEEVYLNSFCFGYRPNSLDELVPEFSQFFFRSNKVRKEIVKLAQGSTRFNMSKVELMKLKFDLPKKGEQQKIASFLSSIDKSIEKLGNQIEQSQEWKKGLLQKMFV